MKDLKFESIFLFIFSFKIVFYYCVSLKLNVILNGDDKKFVVLET